MVQSVVKEIVWLVVLVLVQALVLNRVHILGYATPLPYIYLVLKFRAGSSRDANLIWAFCLGLLVDVFSNTPGVASASTVLLAMLQPFFLKLFSIKEDNAETNPSAREMGNGAFMRYVFTCVLCHHIVFYLLDSFSFFNWPDVLINMGGSTIFTSLLIFALEGIASKKD